jgi:BlaI family transcriptional regulator, penicillinase repressor
MRSGSASGNRPGELEHLVMNYVWNNPDCTAEDCRQAAASRRAFKESTIRTVLTRLERKGLVTHELEKRTYRYRAAAPRGSFAARAVKQIIDKFCGGSVEQLLVGLVDHSVVDRRTLEKVARKTDSRRGAK